MSGYGAVWCPYAYFNALYSEKQKLVDASRARVFDIRFLMDSTVKVKYDLVLLNEKKRDLEKSMESKPSSWSVLNLFVRSKESAKTQ